jgi:sugar transferase (PEP-CTERM/EpsH1 system associated)
MNETRSAAAAPPHQLAARNGHRKHILLLVHRVPYPPDKGERIVAFHLLSRLAGLGEVDLAFLTDEPLSEASYGVLSQLCRRASAVTVSRRWRWVRAGWSFLRGRSLTEGLFHSQALRNLVGTWLAETRYDAVVCFSSGVLPYVLGRGLERRLIADLVDVDSQKFFDYAGCTWGLKAAVLRLEGRRVRALERQAMRACAVAVVTEVEATLYRSFCPGARIVTIPTGVDLEYYQSNAGANEPGGCVFVGQLDYRANVLGLQWFCDRVWPAVRAHLPDATFKIVGRSPVAAVRRLEAIAGVTVIGGVPDVRPYIAAARVVVVPLLVARGVQTKVLEAMAMGKAIVASPEALKGLNLVVGRDALDAAESDEWCRQIAKLWNDSGRRAELGRNARQFVEVNHRWEACLRTLDGLIVDAACARGSGRGD